MGRTARFQEVLRRLAIVDEGFAGDQAGLGLGVPGAWVLDAKTAALVRVGALAAIGSPAVCLEWSTSRALAAGATEDEITDVLLAIAPVVGLGRVVDAAPGVADGFGYDIEAALQNPDGRLRLPYPPDQPASGLGQPPRTTALCLPRLGGCRSGPGVVGS